MITTYKKHIIFKADKNSSGVKYYTRSKLGTFRSDTLEGIKLLISKIK